MPRPQRIEYEGAFHHVMNRGRARQRIFHGNNYYEAFLETLKEASERFDAVIHAYSLMSNHYHLLIETPKANLSRIMRHVNGVYTQRYNRLKNIDGPLFRGRYKSILVDKDAYLLQLSRYIHLNPIDMKRPLVVKLEDYAWSSYPAYINKAKSPEWLHREKIYQMLGRKKKYQGYHAYVEQGVDEEILHYYSKGNISSVLGDNEFRETVRQETEGIDLDRLRGVLQDRPAAEQILKLIAQLFDVEEKHLTQNPKERRRSNPARAFAMYACQHYGALSLKEIADIFELSHTGSASFSINKIKKGVLEGEWKKMVKQLENTMYIVK